jgi:hypothetical protein
MSPKHQIYVPGTKDLAPDLSSPEKIRAAGASKQQGKALSMQAKGGGGNAQAQQHLAVNRDVESGRPLAQAKGGGGNAQAQQHLAVNRDVESGRPLATQNTQTADVQPELQHYTVEICAWIPHARVVDPEEPLRVSDWLDTISDLVPPTLANPNYEFESHYRGDNHVGYNVDKVRVWARIDFDWDGSTISGVRVTGDTGDSHRDWSKRLEVETLGGYGPSWVISEDSGTETGKAAAGESGAGSGAQFSIAFSSKNPLVLTWAPAINSNLTGTIGADGGLDIDFKTDFFPSHGIQVSRNGVMVHQEMVRDASDVPGEGAAGAAAIGAYLSSQSNDGEIELEP